MPPIRDLTPLDDAEVRALPGLKTVVKSEAKFAQKAVLAADLKSQQAKWAKSLTATDIKQPAAKAVQAVKFTAKDLDKLTAVNTSTAATAEILNQDLQPDQMVGILYSSVTMLGYAQANSDYKAERAAAADKAAVDAKWQKVVAATAGAFDAAGVKGLKEADLTQMAAELNRKKANFNAVATIANSAKDETPADGKKPFGNFVTVLDVLPLATATVTPLPANLCSQPFAQGSFTRHFSHSFNLQVTLTVLCFGPHWYSLPHFCQKTFTLAGASFSVDVSVAYKVTCCGAIVSGSAAVQACATIVGISVCATCTATITGVAGFGRTGTGSSCTYGMGINAQLQCKLAGITLLNVQAPFGWNITGPCPPAGLC